MKMECVVNRDCNCGGTEGYFCDCFFKDDPFGSSTSTFRSYIDTVESSTIFTVTAQ